MKLADPSCTPLQESDAFVRQDILLSRIVPFDISETRTNVTALITIYVPYLKHFEWYVR